MSSTSLSDRWLIGAEVGILLQLVMLPVVYQAGTQQGPIVEQLLAIGGVALAVPVIWTATVFAVWQDMNMLEKSGFEELSQVLWLALTVLLPVLGAGAYVSQYGRRPVSRGLLGRVLGNSGGEYEIGTDSEYGTDDSSTTDGDSEPTAPDGSPPAAPVDFGTGVQNELPEYETIEQFGQSNGTEVTLVSLADPEIPAVKKSTLQGGTVNRVATEAMLDEAETWASVDDHPNVVSVYGWGGTPYPWILIEYVDGGDIHTINPDDTSYSEAISLLTGICDGLLHGHERGIYHLDVKPDNVLIDDTDGTAKLSDWGSAVRFQEGLDAEEFTPAYTAPELLPSTEGADPSPRSDIFEVGIIAYELLTGIHPFREDQPEETITAIRSETPKPPSDLNSDLPRGIDDPILTALAKDPDDRYKTVTHFKTELDTAAD
ncbi:hypothetical protein DM826_00905 [Halonotius aquaticus]|uniref:non-specific serine/threonine protein kinase n=1 Tax=Halonotius aquaticus TaxID=2216978 RepID=A0A3A6PWV3_9EURY|nr:serine/threonine-protein kinase [Halonotius aquaticus]RJX45020.1 hypothetical protein DM826_00905 [Halonotius aquaticus]